jgi:hypothetical protein
LIAVGNNRIITIVPAMSLSNKLITIKFNINFIYWFNLVELYLVSALNSSSWLLFFKFSSLCFIIDLSNLKLFINIIYLIIYAFFMILFSFFPTIMFFFKFFFLFLFINHSFSWVFSIVIYLFLIYQGFFLRSIINGW